LNDGVLVFTGEAVGIPNLKASTGDVEVDVAYERWRKLAVVISVSLLMSESEAGASC
jgi:hypothetical protein